VALFDECYCSNLAVSLLLPKHGNMICDSLPGSIVGNPTHRSLGYLAAWLSPTRTRAYRCLLIVSQLTAADLGQYNLGSHLLKIEPFASGFSTRRTLHNIGLLHLSYSSFDFHDSRVPRHHAVFWWLVSRLPLAYLHRCDHECGLPQGATAR
jgi:hypothetical protein